MDKKLREELIETISSSVPNLIAVTGGLGVSFGQNKKFYPGAKKAIQNRKNTRYKDELWLPLVVDKKPVLACGLKSKKDPKEEARLISALFEELRYKVFLKNQVKKFADPKNDFIRRLLKTEATKTMEEAIDKGDILGINLRSSQAVILIRTPGFLKGVQDKCRTLSSQKCRQKIEKECRRVSRLISRGFKNYDQNLAIYFEEDLFLVLKSTRGPAGTLDTIDYFRKKAEYIKKITEKATKTTVTAGVGQYYPGISGLRKSFHDAEAALDLGTRIWGEGKTYHITDIGMLVSLSEKVDFDRKCELAHQMLGEILTDKETFETVRALFKNNMNLTETAKEIRVHRNTLIYRLERVKKKTGLDPRKFKDAAQIKLGLILYSPIIGSCKEE